MTPLKAIAICRKYGSLLRLDFGIMGAICEFVKLNFLYFAPHSYTSSICAFQAFSIIMGKFAEVSEATTSSLSGRSLFSLVIIAQIRAN
jgi:hypothetical protein